MSFPYMSIRVLYSAWVLQREKKSPLAAATTTTSLTSSSSTTTASLSSTTATAAAATTTAAACSNNNMNNSYSYSYSSSRSNNNSMQQQQQHSTWVPPETRTPWCMPPPLRPRSTAPSRACSSAERPCKQHFANVLKLFFWRYLSVWGKSLVPRRT